MAKPRSVFLWIGHLFLSNFSILIKFCARYRSPAGREGRRFESCHPDKKVRLWPHFILKNHTAENLFLYYNGAFHSDYYK